MLAKIKSVIAEAMADKDEEFETFVLTPSTVLKGVNNIGPGGVFRRGDLLEELDADVSAPWGDDGSIALYRDGAMVALARPVVRD